MLLPLLLSSEAKECIDCFILCYLYNNIRIHSTYNMFASLTLFKDKRFEKDIAQAQETLDGESHDTKITRKFVSELCSAFEETWELYRRGVEDSTRDMKALKNALEGGEGILDESGSF